MSRVNFYASQSTIIDSNVIIMDNLKPSSEIIDPIDLTIDTAPKLGVIFPYVTNLPPPNITNYNQSTSRFMKYLKGITTCSVILGTFKTSVTCNGQIIYETYAINKWLLERGGTSLITRVPININLSQNTETLEFLIEAIKDWNIDLNDFKTNEHASR